MKIIEALEEVLQNEQRLGDKNFELSHDQLNDFFYYVNETPIEFPNANQPVVEAHKSEEETKTLSQHSTPPVLLEKLEVKEPKETPIRKLPVQKPEEEFSPEATPQPQVDLSGLTLSELRKTAVSCNKCTVSFNDEHEDKQAKVMFVLDSSLIKGELQDPFDGPSGEFFKKMLLAMKLNLENVYVAKIHRCPRSSDLKEQVAAILQQMKNVKPQSCVVCSPSIIREISDFESINQCRGKWLEWDGIKIMPTYSPAFLMRSENVYGKVKKKEAWSDLQLVMHDLEN
ncbi:uracil-DNA glycosylase family protein [Lentisphaera marina]|uniref:uracil-DNA glycosylase family protein n=1 Tax=Lentisphaera marina TaxID=1111041 RepID=UPI0023651347|nr:uracil-DNA glycosylase family protein [Lentisphaera marina]MDD7986250.1 uracil-DNA glycosylase family protein [Lentisphaera marina]